MAAKGSSSWTNLKRLGGKFSKEKEKPQPTTQANHVNSIDAPTNLEEQKPDVKDTLPSTKAYAFEATRRTLELLTNIIDMAGIPLVKSIMKLGLSIVSKCETINKVTEKAAELKNRVAGFLVVIAKAAKELENDPASQRLMEELEEFKQCLVSISAHLQAIPTQSVVLTTLLPAANLDTIQTCMDCLQDGIERFHMLRSIHADQDLTKVQNQLEDFYGLISHRFDELRVLIERSQPGTGLIVTSIELPPLPDVFLGRKTVVDRVAQQLASCEVAQSRVCVLGPGGIGKSSVALAIMEHPDIKMRFPSKNRLWIPCISLRSPNALLDHLARRLGTSTRANLLESTLSALQNDGPYLIFFDNFETPWHPVEGKQATTKSIIQSLDKLATVSILVTMRSEFSPLLHWKTEPLEVLSLEDCRKIYTTITSDHGESQELNTLIESVGCLPYAVTLLAKQAVFSGSMPSELLKRWTMNDTSLLWDVEGSTKGMEASIKLSLESRSVVDCPGATELLQTLSLLPAGIYRDSLSIWMKSWNGTALGTLRNAALVMSREVVTDGQTRLHLYVLPVVQSYFRQSDRIPPNILASTHETCLAFLLMHKCVVGGPNAPEFRQSLDAITAQEANIQAILTEVLEAWESPTVGQQSQSIQRTSPSSSPSEEHMEALLTFIWYQRYTKPRLDIAKRVATFISLHLEGTLNDALAKYCLAFTNRCMRCMPTAAELFEEAKVLFLRWNQLIQACDADFFAIRSIKESEDSSQKSRFSLPLAVAEAEGRWEQHASDPVISAMVAWEAAYLYSLELPEGTTYSHILNRLMVAKPALIAHNRPADALSCLRAIIKILLREGRLDEARASLEEAFELTKRHGLPTYGGLHRSLTQCLKASESWGPELTEAITESIALARKAGLPYEAAMALEESAEVYINEKDWAAARLAYEEALKECKKGSGSSIDKVAKRVELGLEYAVAKQRDPDDRTVKRYLPPRW